MFDASARLPDLSTGWQAVDMVLASDLALRPPLDAGDAAQDGDSARFAFGLLQADVDEFRRIIHAECGEELSPEDAWHRATEVVALFRMLLGPLPEDSTARSYPQA